MALRVRRGVRDTGIQRGPSPSPSLLGRQLTWGIWALAVVLTAGLAWAIPSASASRSMEEEISLLEQRLQAAEEGRDLVAASVGQLQTDRRTHEEEAGATEARLSAVSEQVASARGDLRRLDRRIDDLRAQAAAPSTSSSQAGGYGPVPPAPKHVCTSEWDPGEQVWRLSCKTV